MSLGTMEQRTEEVKRQVQELMEFAYERGAKAGHEDMKNLMHNGLKKEQQELIEQGRNESWEAARKLCKIPYNEEYRKMGFESNVDDWYYEYILENYTAAEAIQKIREYEEKQKQDDICAGDEVQSNSGFRYVVIRVLKNGTFEGIGSCGADEGLDLSKFHKTGRTFPQITEVLKKLQEDQE